MTKPLLHLAAAAVFFLSPRESEACATCGCTLSSDAAMGYTAEPGWRLSLEYDYIHQDQLRSGKHAVFGVPDGVELERETLNRYVTLGLDFTPTPDWNIDLRLPYVIRTHSTFGAYDSTAPSPQSSDSRSSSFGDVRVIGAFQGWLPAHNLGLQLGVKLPTGHYGTEVHFRGGPLAGDPLDASLQPGTGSTDVIVGAYLYQPIGRQVEVFANVQFQSALVTKQDRAGEDYRPGNSTTVSVGLRWEGDPRWAPQLQVNWLHKSVDTGALADITDTEGYVAYLSPGVTLQAVGNLHVFAFAQLPLYSDLVGYQVFPRYSFSVGASYGF